MTEPGRIQPQRRRMVEMLFGSSLFGSIVSAFYPVLGYLVPPPIADLGGDEIVAAKVGDLKPAERDYRRKGLGFALVFILLTVLGLFLNIRQMEQGAPKS